MSSQLLVNEVPLKTPQTLQDISMALSYPRELGAKSLLLK